MSFVWYIDLLNDMHFFSFGTRSFSRLRCTAIGQYTTEEDAILAADGAFKKDMNFKAQTRHQTGAAILEIV